MYIYEWTDLPLLRVGVLHHFNFTGGSLAEKCNDDVNNNVDDDVNNNVNERR